jgi:hypothetical protein
VHTAYGHFLLQAQAWVDVPEVSFDSARPDLREIAIREDPDLEYRALAYWQDHRREFLTPDTLLLAAWLNPDAAAAPKGRSRLIGPGLALRNTWLPETVREALPDSLPRCESICGPVRTSLGTWYFRKLSLKPGGRPMPFRQVREAVKERVLLPPATLYESMREGTAAILKEDFEAMAVERRAYSGNAADRGNLPAYAALIEEKKRWMARLETAFPPAPEPPPAPMAGAPLPR